MFICNEYLITTLRTKESVCNVVFKKHISPYSTRTLCLTNMNYYVKIILILIFYSIINPILVGAYIGTSGLPGGNVGMLPLLILLASIITIPISLLILYLIRLRKVLEIGLPIMLNNFIYITVLVYFGINPFYSELGQEYAKLDFIILLISFMSSGILFIVFKIFNKVGSV